MTAIPFVRGIALPSLNPCQQSLLDLFVEEMNKGQDRIDQVTVINDYRILITTSTFIPLEKFRSSTTPTNHLQIQSVHVSWDDDPQPNLELSDPYSDLYTSKRYREVYLTSVYRTWEGDPGWVTSMSPLTYQADTSDTHVWNY